MNEDASTDLLLSIEADKKINNSEDVSLRTLLPGSRLDYIELVEEAAEGMSVSRNSITCQSLVWEVKCPKAWESMLPTELDDVRVCPECEERVYTAYSREDIDRLSSQGSCIRLFKRPHIGSIGLLRQADNKVTGKNLVDAIIEVDLQLQSFLDRRGYYSVVKLKKLINRLEHYQQQIEKGLRDSETGYSSDGEYLTVEEKNDFSNMVERVKCLIKEKQTLINEYRKITNQS